jgi:LysR family transcriptional activator of glutamate synthase operon
MDLKQLRSLVALYDEQHFTRAAARLHIAQPALSNHIRTLEAELGVTLVQRTTRRMEFTEAGRRLVARARSALGELDVARQELDERAGVLAGALRIGMTLSPSPVDVPGLLAAFHSRHPGIVLALHEDISVALADALRAMRIDLAFVTQIEGPEAAGLDFVLLADEPLVLVVAPGHRLAASRTVSLERLADETFVSVGPQATIRESFTTAARAAGFEPRVMFETNDIPRVRALVARGLGVAALPRSYGEAPGPEVRVVGLRGARIEHRVLLASRTGARDAPAVRAFRRVVAER